MFLFKLKTVKSKIIQQNDKMVLTMNLYYCNICDIINMSFGLYTNLKGGVGVMKIKTYDEAILRIKELEEENKQLKVEIEELKNRKMSGRKKHNDKWMASYNDFAVLYEKGMTIVENAKINNISVRTAYRYKAYYDALKNKL